MRVACIAVLASCIGFSAHQLGYAADANAPSTPYTQAGQAGELIDLSALADQARLLASACNISLTYRQKQTFVDANGKPFPSIFTVKIRIGSAGRFLLEHECASKLPVSAQEWPVTGHMAPWFKAGNFIISRSTSMFSLLDKQSGTMLVRYVEKKKENQDRYEADVLAMTRMRRLRVPIGYPYYYYLDLPGGSIANEQIPFWYFLRPDEVRWHFASENRLGIKAANGGMLVSVRTPFGFTDDPPIVIQLEKFEELKGKYLATKIGVEGNPTTRDQGGHFDAELAYRFAVADAQVNGSEKIAVVEKLEHHFGPNGKLPALTDTWQLDEFTIHKTELTDSDFAISFDEAKEIVDFASGLTIER